MPEETIQLSDREQEILRLVATGASNQQIATSLDISINTVKVHMRNIFGKIGASSRTEATLYAMRLGLVDIGPRGEETPVVAPTLATPPIAAEVAALPDMPEGSAVAVADEPPSDVLPDEAVSPLLVPTLGPGVAAAAEPLSAPIPPTNPWLKRGATALAGLLALLLGAFGVYQFVTPRGEATATSTSTTAQLSRWKSHAALPQARTDFAVASYEGQLYAIGGQGPSGPLDTVARLDPTSDQWVTLINKPTPVSNVQAAVVDGRICVPGGEGADGQPTTAFECYNPRGERWETFASLPAPRSRYALASVEGNLYLFGGWDGAQYRSEVFAYDPDAQTWQTLTPMPTARRNAGAAIIDNRVYIIGGEDASGALRVNERYDPTAEGDSEPWSGAVPLPEAIANPAAVGIANLALVFDSERQTALQFVPARNSWSSFSLPPEITVSSRAATTTTAVLVFGQGQPGQPPTLNEYPVYTTNLPVLP